MVMVLLMNLELRLPLLVYYFPAIKYLGQISAVLFLILDLLGMMYYLSGKKNIGKKPIQKVLFGLMVLDLDLYSLDFHGN